MTPSVQPCICPVLRTKTLQKMPNCFVKDCFCGGSGIGVCRAEKSKIAAENKGLQWQTNAMYSPDPNKPNEGHFFTISTFFSEEALQHRCQLLDEAGHAIPPPSQMQELLTKYQTDPNSVPEKFQKFCIYTVTVSVPSKVLLKDAITKFKNDIR